MKSYLLGELDEKAAAIIEERYFTDRAFFLLVQSVETALIEDYLAGRLSPFSKVHFESRYLTVPDLRLRLDEVRRKRATVRGAGRQLRYARLRLAAAALLLCLGVSALWLYRDRMQYPSLPSPTVVRPILATISLSPGLLKDSGSRLTHLRPSLETGDVRLVLDLPGQSAGVVCSARVSAASADGAWKIVWSTPQPVWSTPSRGGQQLALILDASLFGRGDYLVEVAGVNTAIQETYYFRVSPM